ncbi:acyl-CoA dehydrogenase family protein [Rhizosphaericola mali]|uniref:Acyl-CoA dehydrogenase n=1 Tax=Rhizosphaericola mali TaxID=2545455 RepID=A0A5P2G6J0_9BACT|nr:acyl-CoA dehydrogenase family protein [Rhizosphaericola mali]QES89410.1 acyl-CoA dehydrogenase [Rhizosphaericola mali]
MSTKTKAIKGGEFIIKETAASDIFIPEQWNEEQLMMKKTCEDFLAQEVYPNLERIDKLEEGLMPSIVEKAGELGILGANVPEEYGGLGFDFVTGMLTSEVIGMGYSAAVAIMAHTGIGTLPILYYGNEEQKQKYVPKLASGEWKASYALTEPSAGSDANSGKTKATLSEDGKHYILNGQKMWITNAGFADVFTVFAKIDDDKKLSAFIVEKTYPGISLNAEEKKMGIKGSSTRQVFFNDCKVPVENLLSTRENGFKIAVNILNIGRIKLGGGAIGASKSIIANSIKYANEREQFGRPISKYGAIRFKLAEQAIKTYVSEAALYRASQNIDDAIAALHEEGLDFAQAKLKGIEQFAVECAILKVHGSETLDYVADEGVQIYGGMGFSAEAPMDRAYRDARINRIFEGTNEINRILIVDMILKRAMKGELDLMGPAQAVAQELTSIPSFDSLEDTSTFAKEKEQLKKLKKALMLVAGGAVQKLMQNLAKEEEVLMNIADMAIEIYAAESGLLRVEKVIDAYGEEAAGIKIDIAKTYLNDATDKIWKAGKDALNSFADGDELRMMLMGLKRYTKQEPFNVKEARQKIAQKLIADGSYTL